MRTEMSDIAEIVDENPWAAWGALIVAAGVVLIVAFVASWIFSAVTGRLSGRAEVFTELQRRFPRPIFFLLAVIGWRGSVAAFFPRDFAEARGAASYALTLAIIAVTGWILGKVVIFLLDGAQRRQDSSVGDEFTVRRRRTQLRMIRSLVIAIVVVLTAAAMLLTIPGAKAFGASLFASAGLVSIVAGLAAQSTLGNLIAGIQLAFSNALKVGDTVEVNDQFGKVEEITLTYVVVQIWDDRRHVLPSTYFTTTPYTNWTRNQTQLTGTVYFEADYNVDVAAVRAEVERILDRTPEWDRRSWGLVVTDASGGVAQLRATMTAADGDQLWTLRCAVREQIIAFLANSRPQDLARSRFETIPTPEA
ncbi:mechanosensitive ion channel protein MscS [Microbacterium sorbitolivorans]|uniref:Potassium transporter KefA n=1 Tax=Microbacterium sorbitolivorans TaxID=1867410 RepID=A0A367XY03_9MICO|nr:mechanosensitive ion channel domain-containing protein [Microbacterium sorbitolivorans]RCK58488.1 potassium transporter KefA [Microbacterium sorbitolivorans]GGF36934.1 mechanosensitive ion channel protein MscS [Microbacterium sorbitolivorans]